MRSGQPHCGPSNHRCAQDEAILNATLSRHRRGHIIDTRSSSVAKEHKHRGGQGIGPGMSFFSFCLCSKMNLFLDKWELSPKNKCGCYGRITSEKLFDMTLAYFRSF